MCRYSFQLRSKLDNCISEMESVSSLFALNPSIDFTRKRTLSFSTIIKIILSMAGNSLNKELYDFFKNTNKFATASAFVQQRAKLLPEAFEYLLREFNNQCYDSKIYDGYRLYAVDGTDVNIAKNPHSDSYVENGQNEGYNQLHVNALYDLLNKTYVDAIVQPRPQMHEVKAAIELIKRNSSSGKTILIADRGYGSMNLMEHVNRTANLEYLIRVKNDYIKEFKNLPLEDFDTMITVELRTTQTNEDKALFSQGKAKWISGPSKYNKTKKTSIWDFESPFSLKFRVVRFEIANGVYETIVTSLDKIKFPASKIKELYHLRWGIETSFRELKYAIGLVNFHAKKEDFIRQEIFARLIMYNFCERITLHVVIKQSKSRKWTYQANFTMGIHICIDFFRYHGKEPPNVEKLISRYILPVREGRADIRKLKPKSVVFFLYRVA